MACERWPHLFATIVGGVEYTNASLSSNSMSHFFLCFANACTNTLAVNANQRHLYLEYCQLMPVLFSNHDRAISASLVSTKSAHVVQPDFVASQKSNESELTGNLFVKTHPLAPSLSPVAQRSRLSPSTKAIIVPRMKVTSF